MVQVPIATSVMVAWALIFTGLVKVASHLCLFLSSVSLLLSDSSGPNDMP